MSSRKNHRITFSLRSVLILLLIQVLLIMALVWPREATTGQVTATALETPTPQPTLIVEPSDLPVVDLMAELPTAAPAPISTAAIPADLVSTLSQGWIALSLNDNGYAHLFAYQPQTLPLTRLTNHPWDDIHPAISPDGTRLAFSSRQNGYWDLFLLDLQTGEQTRLTDTPEYEGAPSWSPDSSWLAYEAYTDSSLDLWIRSALDPALPAIRLTDDPAADRSPAWSPQGRLIAFISNRSGENEVWMADLDNTDTRFSRLALRPSSSEDHPLWNADGSLLLFSSNENGALSAYSLDPRATDRSQPRRLGAGSWPAWSPSGALLASLVEEPNRVYLTAFAPGVDSLLMPPVAMPGAPHGLAWTGAPLPNLMALPFVTASQGEVRSLFSPLSTPLSEGPLGRYNVVEIPDVTVQYPYLHDRVDEAFNALRHRLSTEAGWDILANLENAYLPLTAPLYPGMKDDWLYTGRAYTINSAALNAGWIAVVREDLAGATYWRVYVKARYQDGSQGAPIPSPIWDLAARGSGDPGLYDQGGRISPTIPSGYWIDLTDLSSRYGWERLPAMMNWRSYFPGARFNQFAITEGMDLQNALNELYPREAFYTPTPVRSATPTPTATPTWYRTRIPTNTPTPSITPTRRPTWTPLP